MDLRRSKDRNLLMALGEETASEVLKTLAPKEVQAVVMAMAQLQSVPRETVDSVVDQFSKELGSQSGLVPDTEAYLRAVLHRALGQERAGLLLDRVLQNRDDAGLESLRWMEGPAVAALLGPEHPQIIATVLAQLDKDQAAAVLAAFDEEVRNNLIFRIATLDGVQPLALEELNQVMSRVLSGAAQAKKVSLGGVKSAAEILNFMGSRNQNMLASIASSDPELSQKIADLMFVFGDLMKLDNKAVQLLLREISSDSLILAMKGCEPNLRDKFFANMSQRAAETLREDLESKGPVKLSDVEAEHKEILKTVKRLADEGQIVLASAGAEDALV